MAKYDLAQICPNGHVANSHMQLAPNDNRKHCPRCGEKTLTNCPSCEERIRGEMIGLWGFFTAPSFCEHCGAIFPWAERQRQAAIDLFLEEIQDEKDRQLFQESIDQISKDTPQAQVASNRIVKLLKKVGTGVAGAIKEIAVNIASEQAKKIISAG